MGLPNFQLCKFDVTSILVMAPIAVASMMEHIGDMSAISATTKRNFIEEPGLQRTLLGDGLATPLAGLIGGPANTTYGENTGVLELSKVYDPLVIRLAAVYAIILSFIPKFLRHHLHHARLHHRRRVLHALRHDLRHRRAQRGGEQGGPDQVPEPDHRRRHLRLRPGLLQRPDLHLRDAHITLTGLAIAAIAGILLNAILPGKDYEFTGKPARADSGSFGNLGEGEEIREIEFKRK